MSSDKIYTADDFERMAEICSRSASPALNEDAVAMLRYAAAEIARLNNVVFDVATERNGIYEELCSARSEPTRLRAERDAIWLAVRESSGTKYANVVWITERVAALLKENGND